MSWRQLVHAGLQRAVLFLAIKRCVRRVSGIGDIEDIVSIDTLVCALSQKGERLESGDRDKPGENSRATFEPVCGAPDIQEHLTDDILRNCRIANDPMDKAEHSRAVTREHDVHRGFVTFRDTLEKHLIRDVLLHNVTICFPIVRSTPRKMRRLVNGISQFAMAHHIGQSA